MIAIRCTIKYLRHAAGIHRILERRRPLGTEFATINRAFWIALNVKNLPILDIHIQTTANRTVRAHAFKYLRPTNARSLLYALDAERLYSRTNLHHLRNHSLHR